MKRLLSLALLIYIGIQIAIKCGYRQEKESDYILDMNDSIVAEKKPTLKIRNFKPDTTQYKGNWVDLQE